MAQALSKPLKGRRAVVIGSDVGGLCAAVALALRGARVIVIEQGPVLAPKLRPARIGKTSIDTQPTLIAPSVFAELYASADLRLTDFLTLERDPLIARVLLNEKTHLDLYRDTDQLVEEFARIDPGDARRLRGFLGRAGRYAGVTDACVRGTARTLASRLMEGRMLRAPGALFDPRSAASYISRSFRSAEIRNAVMSLGVLVGGSPYLSPLMALGRWGSLLRDGGWRVAGGSEELRQALLRLGREVGVRYLKKATIERIELYNGRPRRVVGQGFKPLTVSLVVSTLPAGETLRRFFAREDREDLKAPPAFAYPHASFQAVYTVRKPLGDRLQPVTVLASTNPREDARFVGRWGVASPHAPVSVLYQAPEGEGVKGIVSAKVTMPTVSHRYTWNDGNIEETEHWIQRRFEWCGVKPFAPAIVEKTLRPPTPDRNPRPVGTDNWQRYRRTIPARFLRRHPYRLEAVPALYIASPEWWMPGGYAADALAGVMAAMAAAEDAVS